MAAAFAQSSALGGLRGSLALCGSVLIPNVSSLPLRTPYLSLLLLHPQDSGCNLDCGQGLRIAASCGGDVRDHGGAAVHIPQRLSQEHGELALPAKQSGLGMH